MSPALADDRGSTSVALLTETIGENLARTAAKVPDQDALVDCASGRCWT